MTKFNKTSKIIKKKKEKSIKERVRSEIILQENS